MGDTGYGRPGIVQPERHDRRGYQESVLLVRRDSMAGGHCLDSGGPPSGSGVLPNLGGLRSYRLESPWLLYTLVLRPDRPAVLVLFPIIFGAGMPVTDRQPRIAAPTNVFMASWSQEATSSRMERRDAGENDRGPRDDRYGGQSPVSK